MRWSFTVRIVALAVVPLMSFAQAHSHYVQALRELQFARAALPLADAGSLHLAVDLRRATDEIDGVIKDLKIATEMDGRNATDLPQIDVHWTAHDRLLRAADSLERARTAIAQEDRMNPAARSVRDRSFRHIDEAEHALHHAMTLH